jgi:phosphatidylglycerophosphate synthase
MASVTEDVESIVWNWRFWMVQLITTIRLILSIAFPLVGITATARVTLLVYLAAIITDIADGALARRWKCATRGGDWFDAFADRMLTTMSGAYGLLIGGSALACSLIISRDLSAASMNELQSEGSNQRARFLGIVTVTPIRVVTLYILGARLYDLEIGGVSLLYWVCAAIAWSTFAVNAWLRRATVAARFREPDVEKLLR